MPVNPLVPAQCSVNSNSNSTNKQHRVQLRVGSLATATQRMTGKESSPGQVVGGEREKGRKEPQTEIAKEWPDWDLVLHIRLFAG